MNDYEYEHDPLSPSERDVRQWGMFLHFSVFAGYIAPVLGLIAPIIIWQIKKDEMPTVDEHGKNVVNWLISMGIYTILSVILCFFLIGIPLLIALGLAGVVLPIIAGIKANNGEIYEYPLSIRFFS